LPIYGGGTQNGRFVHTGRKIQIVNESAWMDGGVASPNPFYYTTGGYGVLRNTFSDGLYDFGELDADVVTAAHKEHHFSAYYFVTERDGGRQIVMDLTSSFSFSHKIIRTEMVLFVCSRNHIR